jgi:hypothetical protein
MAQSTVEAADEQHDPGALNAWLMLLGVQLLMQVLFQGSEGVRLVRAIAELHPSMSIFKWGVALVVTGACLLSLLAGVMLFAWRRPVTMRVLYSALWIGSPVTGLVILTATAVALDLTYAKVWDSSAPFSLLRSVIIAGLWSLYLYRSRIVRARYCTVR